MHEFTNDNNVCARVLTAMLQQIGRVEAAAHTPRTVSQGMKAPPRTDPSSVPLQIHLFVERNVCMLPKD
jgi:hypothetical protein